LVEEQAKHLASKCAMASLARYFPDVDFLMVTEIDNGQQSLYLSEQAVMLMPWDEMYARSLHMWMLVETEEDTEHDEEFHRGHSN